MTQCEICEEIGCKDCVNCSLGNPCLNCEDYDRQNDVCKSSSGCADIGGENNDKRRSNVGEQFANYNYCPKCGAKMDKE